MNALYNKEILRLAASLPAYRRVDDPVISVTKTSRICGSRITIAVKIEDGEVADYSQEVKACALGQASSAIVAKNIIGKTWHDFAPVAEKVETLLKEEGPPPDGEWAEFQVFLPARPHKSRHSAILLPFEALREAFALARTGQ